MTRSWTVLYAVVPILLTALLVGADMSAPVSPRSLTPQEQRGQEIYRRGTSPSGHEITAVLGKEDVAVPASVLPCVNCHGYDGRGKPEGGVTPSNITWEALTKPYGVTHPGGRRHPPYTERLLQRAITMGIDAAGQRLHVAMPRYRLSHSDITDLVAYLKQLGKLAVPGVAATAIRVGIILPPPGLLADMGRAVKAVLTAYVDEINAQGGIYNRRIELNFAELPKASTARAQAVRAFLDETQVFTLLGSFLTGAESEIAALVEEKEVPLVGAFTLYPPVSFPLNRYIFYLYAGPREQGRALVKFITQKYANPPTAIIYPDEELAREVAETIRQQCQRSGWQAVEKVGMPSGPFNMTSLVQRLHEQGTEIVFYLGPPVATKAFFQEAQARTWRPIVLMPDTLADREIFNVPASFDGRIFLSFPTWQVDHTPDGRREYHRLAARHQLSSNHLLVQFSALASAKILVEGLKRAGRDVSREKLLEALEGLYEFRTGFIPPITYGPNQRIGAMGAYVVTISLEVNEFVPVSTWIKLN